MKNIFRSMLLLTTLLSCYHRPSGTETGYKNKHAVDPNLYRKDSMEIHGVLDKMLTEHLHPFLPENQFDTSTAIYIDSIIYSPDKLKMIVFAVTRNSTNKLLKKENDEPYFYNANYLFCSREKMEMPVQVYDYTGFNLVYYYNYQSVKQRLHEYCFSDLSKEHKVNVDDVRFWNSDELKWVMENSVGTHL